MKSLSTDEKSTLKSILYDRMMFTPADDVMNWIGKRAPLNVSRQLSDWYPPYTGHEKASMRTYGNAGFIIASFTDERIYDLWIRMNREAKKLIITSNTTPFNECLLNTESGSPERHVHVVHLIAAIDGLF